MICCVCPDFQYVIYITSQQGCLAVLGCRCNNLFLQIFHDRNTHDGGGGTGGWEKVTEGLFVCLFIVVGFQ